MLERLRCLLMRRKMSIFGENHWLWTSMLWMVILVTINNHNGDFVHLPFIISSSSGSSGIGIVMSFQPPSLKRGTSPISSKLLNSDSHNLIVTKEEEEEDLVKSIISHKNNDDNNDASSHTFVPWIIVGGGIHGVHVAARLIGEGGIKSESIRILDANESLLYQWKSRTAATGMEYLRSSATHHLDIDPESLRREYDAPTIQSKKRRRNKKPKQHSNMKSEKKKPFFTNDYKRPRLDVFNQHCDSVVEKYGLDQLYIQGIVTSIQPSEEYVKIELSPSGNNNEEQHNYYYAHNIILALGNDDPLYADWVDEEDIKQGYVHHLFHRPNHNPTEISDMSYLVHDKDVKDVAVIGGGITAAHKALQMARDSPTQSPNYVSTGRNKRNVHLISKNEIKEQQFDTHSDWMMDLAASKRSLDGGGQGRPKRQDQFANCSSYQQRRRTILKERVPGTVTPALNRGKNGLSYAIDKGDIIFHRAEVTHKRYISHPSETTTKQDNEDENRSPTRKRIELSLSCGTKIEVDQVLLATGFGKKPPGGKLIQDLLKTNSGLEVSNFCGYPIVDFNLSWGSNKNKCRIYVTGALAELELGPSARNIAGARLAAERILLSITSNE